MPPKKAAKQAEKKPNNPNRVTMEEMFQSLYIPHKDKVRKPAAPRTTTYYGFAGQGKKDEDDNTLVTESKALAKQVSGASVSYFILADVNKFKNPLDETHSRDRIKGVPRWKWTEVSLKTFNYYLRFLRTTATKFITFAQKEHYGQ